MSEQRRMTFSLTLVNRCNNSRRFKDFSDFRLFYFGLMLAGHEGPFSLLTSVIRIVCILSRWKHGKNFHAIVRDNRYEQRAAKNQELICSRCETFWELDIVTFTALKCGNFRRAVYPRTAARIRIAWINDWNSHTAVQLLFVCLIFHPRLSHRRV